MICCRKGHKWTTNFAKAVADHKKSGLVDVPTHVRWQVHDLTRATIAPKGLQVDESEQCRCARYMPRTSLDHQHQTPFSQHSVAHDQFTGKALRRHAPWTPGSTACYADTPRSLRLVHRCRIHVNVGDVPAQFTMDGNGIMQRFIWPALLRDVLKVRPQRRSI